MYPVTILVLFYFGRFMPEIGTFSRIPAAREIHKNVPNSGSHDTSDLPEKLFLPRYAKEILIKRSIPENYTYDCGHGSWRDVCPGKRCD